MSDMIEVVIDSVRVSLMAPQTRGRPQADGRRRATFTIWVGPYEAEAITVALQEVEMVRPLTHDLLKNVFTAFNARITRIEIVNLQEDIFYGNHHRRGGWERNAYRFAPIGCHRPGRARACADPGPPGCDGGGRHPA